MRGINIGENFNRLSRVHSALTLQTTDRQTDRRWHIANANKSVVAQRWLFLLLPCTPLRNQAYRWRTSRDVWVSH